MAGFYMYIGPNIKGVIHTGLLYRTGEEPAVVKAAVKKKPEVKKLIIADEDLSAALVQVKTPKTELNRTYKALARKKGG